MKDYQKRLLNMNQLQKDVMHLIWFFSIFDKIIETIFAEDIIIENKINFDGEYILSFKMITFYLSKHNELSDLKTKFNNLFWELYSLSNLNNYIENRLWWMLIYLHDEYGKLKWKIKILQFDYKINVSFKEILLDNKDKPPYKQEDLKGITKEDIEMINNKILEFKQYSEMESNLEKKLKKYYKSILKLLDEYKIPWNKPKIWIKNIRHVWDEIIINNWNIKIPLSQMESKAMEELIKIKTVYKNRNEMKEIWEEINIKNLKIITWSISEQATEKLIKSIRSKLKKENLNFDLPIKQKLIKFYIFKS